MVEVMRFQGQTIRADTMVAAPKIRFGLPCYDKSICEVSRCSKYDTVVKEMEDTLRGYKPKFTIYRNPCDEDCKRRLNLAKVSVKVCVKADCEFLKVQEGDRLLHIPPAINCLKYIEESRSKHKPTPFGRETRIHRRGVAGGWHYRDVK